MTTVDIEYKIKCANQRVESFLFNLHEDTFDLVVTKQPDLPKWTELAFCQCSHCPLNPEEHSHCPVAVQLSQIAERFHDTRSIDQVELEVITNDRRVIQTVPIQNALASMLDLVVPVCGCPKTAHLKPMARFHLPIASEEETVFRVTGMYLLAQYFVSQEQSGGRISFKGLAQLYADLHIVNRSISKRVSAMTKSDSMKNAITLVDMYSMLVPALLDTQLSEMRQFFEAFIPEATKEAPKTNYLEIAKSFNLDLEPIEGEQPDADEATLDESDSDPRPGWLRELEHARKAALEPKREEQKAPDEEELRERLADEIISKAGFTLELESMEGNNPEQHLPAMAKIPETKPKPKLEPKEPGSGKSVFQLPD